VLALVFLAAYAWPILQPDISPAWKHVCTVIDILIWWCSSSSSSPA
jgi:voltage-gated potassium channel